MSPCPIDGHKRFRSGAGWKLAVTCGLLPCRCLECNQLAKTEEDDEHDDPR